MRKALIVDDIKENLYLLESLLKAYDFKTINANNGAEALGLALREHPDIIIADILMPVMDGYTFCRECKKEATLKDIPFVFYTATYTHPKDEEFAMSLGADKFIIKPQEPEDFIAMIEQVLSEFRTDKLIIPKHSESSEISLLKEYNETLIRKMEDRMLKSEDAEKKVRIYASQLELEIEQRNQIARALKESEILFRSVVENAAEGFSIADENGRIIIWNDAMARLTGISQREMIGKFAWDLQFLLIPEKQRTEVKRSAFRKLITNFLATGESTFAGKLMERSYKRPDGTEVYIEGRIIPIKTDKGFILVSTVDEITERKIFEEALKDSEHRFRVLAESAPVGIFKTDARGATIYVNPRWCEISQLSFEEAMGDGWLNAIHPDDKDKLSMGWQQTTFAHTSSKAEYRFVHVDGSIAWVIGQAVPQQDKNGRIAGYIGTITDITERKKMEADLITSKEKAEESDRLKSAFLANMSHEVRTPLNSIIGFSELLTDDDFDKIQKNDFIQSIIVNGNNLLSIISDIMDISKLESHEIKIRNCQINVHKFLSDFIKQFECSVQEKKLELRLNFSDTVENGDTVIFADVDRLKQIFNNLVGNALKFTANGQIEIGYQKKGTGIKFYVRDTGIGIPAEYHNKIFDRFRQVDNSTTRKYGGNGLGLAITKNLVELMGGTIWLESEPGKGSTFYFLMPCGESPK